MLVSSMIWILSLVLIQYGDIELSIHSTCRLQDGAGGVHLACLNGKSEMVQMLVETFGLSVDLKDKVHTCVCLCVPMPQGYIASLITCWHGLSHWCRVAKQLLTVHQCLAVKSAREFFWCTILMTIQIMWVYTVVTLILIEDCCIFISYILFLRSPYSFAYFTLCVQVLFCSFSASWLCHFYYLTFGYRAI